MSFTDLLSQLKEEYVNGLPAKIKVIKGLLNSNDLIGLRTEFHKLKGNGRTYGLPEISELAEVVEGHCLETPESALNSVKLAVDILEDIHASRKDSGSQYPLINDPRFQGLTSAVAA